MPDFEGMPWLEKHQIVALINAHYVRRGVPDRKLGQMVFRWLRRNGYRAPQS